LKGVRLALLRRTQARTLHQSAGAIFLTDFARERVLEQIGPVRSPAATIPHGISAEFFSKPRPARPFETFTTADPARLVYVSQVMEAVALLRQRGVMAKLTLIGQASEKAAHQTFLTALQRIDPEGAFVQHIGGVPHEQLSEHYRHSDLFVFASGVETFGNVVVEAMAAGLPIASSNRSAMPEVIGDAGVFFNPTVPVEMAAAIEDVLRRTEFRAELAERAYRRASEFSWRKCAEATFGFLRDCYVGWKNAS
jgi:glycosyltransferase involved in cell wall biosynthesis